MSLIKLSGVTVAVTRAQLEEARRPDGLRQIFEVELNEVQLRSVLDQMLADSRYNKHFDVTLAAGLLAELDFLRMTSGTAEVKFDKCGERTGNMAVETECNGQPSGIEATTADLWVHRFKGDRPFLIWETHKLRAMVTQYAEGNPRSVVYGGDGNRAKFVKIPAQWALGLGVRR